MWRSPRCERRNSAKAVARATSPMWTSAWVGTAGISRSGRAMGSLSVRRLIGDVPDVGPDVVARLVLGFAHQAAQLLAVHDLLLEQALRQLVQDVAVPLQQVECPVVRLAD